MRRHLVLLSVVAGGVFAFDQWTKAWATANLQNRPPVEILGTLVQLTYTRNSGVAFGLGAGTNFPFYLFSIAAALGILWVFFRGRVRRRVHQLALALVLGGALGNLVDRITTGRVVDFVLLSWRQWDFPVFNVADTAVSIGVVLFALTWGGRREEDATGADHEGGAEHGALLAAPRPDGMPAADLSTPLEATPDDPEDVVDAPSADARR